jgi:hypothetical protein
LMFQYVSSACLRMTALLSTNVNPASDRANRRDQPKPVNHFAFVGGLEIAIRQLNDILNPANRNNHHNYNYNCGNLHVPHGHHHALHISLRVGRY